MKYTLKYDVITQPSFNFKGIPSTNPGHNSYEVQFTMDKENSLMRITETDKIFLIKCNSMHQHKVYEIYKVNTF